jgi:hypothetical protein
VRAAFQGSTAVWMEGVHRGVDNLGRLVGFWVLVGLSGRAARVEAPAVGVALGV